MSYDLFISYSRRDNAQGRIAELVDCMKQDFASFGGMLGRELRVFFDQDEIHGMSDWRQRILQGLRESRLLLACISPAYLQSEYCEWEFVEYLKYEIGHLHGFNGVAPIYFVEVPGWESKEFEQQCAAWVTELRKRQHFDLRPWHDEGAEALREAAVQEHIGKLNRQIVQTITRGERAEESLGNVDAHNPHFIGRTANLRMLRENFVKPGHIGVVTAVNGVGGLGKTALAIEYAHAFADEYGGGRWQVRCAGKDDLRLALAELATPIGFEFTDDEKKNADLQFERVRRELKKLADTHTPHRCLLLLDNVDKPSLLDPAMVARLNGGDWLHVLATTRLGENELHGMHRDRSFLPIDELPPDDALTLIESYQPGGRFHNDAERGAAYEIVRLLGCFTLAVESAAVYLGQFAHDVTCAAFLARLKNEGLAGLDTAASQSSEGVLHGEKCLGATLQPTLERLGAPEKLALEFATLLPPDQVPLPWLRALVAKTFPEMERDAEPGHPDPWSNVLRRLLSLRLLQPSAVIDAYGQPLLVRIHRVVAAYVSATAKKVIQEAIERYAIDRATLMARTSASPTEWELGTLLAALPALCKKGCTSSELDRALCLISPGFSEKVKSYRGLSAASSFLASTHAFTEHMVADDPGGSEWKHFFSVSLEKLGALAMAQGNLALALERFTESRSIREELIMREPTRADRRRDLSVSLEKLGEVAIAQGNLDQSLRWLTESVEIRRHLTATDPSNSEWRRDLAVAQFKLSEVMASRGDFTEAHRLVAESLNSIECLIASSPSEPTYQRDLSVVLNSLGNSAASRGDLAGATTWFKKSLLVIEKIAADDPGNVQLRHDVGISNERLGDIAVAQGRWDAAQTHFSRKKSIARELMARDSANADWQRDLTVALNKEGEVLMKLGNLDEAYSRFIESKQILKRLAASDTTNAERQRDLAVVLGHLGDVAIFKTDRAEAIRRFTQCNEILERLAAANCGNAQSHYDAGVSNERLGHLALMDSRVEEAKKFFLRKNEIVERLVADDPGNVRWRRDYSVARIKLGELAIALGDYVEAFQRFTEAKKTTEDLLKTDSKHALWKRDLVISRLKLAEVAQRRGDQMALASELQQCYSVLESMKQDNMQFDAALAQLHQDLAARFRT